MKRFDWRSFILLLAFISTTALAQHVIYSTIGEDDLFYWNKVLIDGVKLPDDISKDSFSSTIDLEGAGTLTIADQVTSNLYVTIFGGTTITAKRKWNSEDEKTAWEGEIMAPKLAQNPTDEEISFKTEGKHENSYVDTIGTYVMGLQNEEFTFSSEANFSLPVGAPDGTKLWIGSLKLVAPGEDLEYEIPEGDFCVVKDSRCLLSTKSFTTKVLVQELFQKCPRSSSSDTQVINGKMSGPPLCTVECNRGYTLNYETLQCVLDEGVSVDIQAGGNVSQVPSETQYVDTGFRPGYFRYTAASEQRNRNLDVDGLTGDAKTRAERINISSQGLKNDVPVVEEVSENEDSFMNYLLQMRNLFASKEKVQEGEISHTEDEDQETSEVLAEGHSSAPLLPSTGPGIFLGLSGLGLACMVVGRKRR